MYTPTTPSVKSVIRDTQIKLPRFQRKKSWNNKKRFELCISMFKGYPLGTIVTKKDKDNGKVVKWLLDGRQRRDTLQEMQNPEVIYIWAKEYLKLKNTMLASDIRERFNECMREYIQYDDDEQSENSDDSSNQPITDESNNIISNESYDSTDLSFSSGLEGLTDIICAVHPLFGKSSSFTKPFFFKDYLTAPYIAKDENEKHYVDSSKLILWLRPHIEIENIDIDNLTPEEISSWYERPTDVYKSVQLHIKGIKNSLKMIQTISNMMDNASIQLIELDSNCKSSDARKIFEIINTQGVPLTGAEILSAKPDWNKPIESPSDEVVRSAEKMYGSLDATFKEVVKWDVCATFTDRLPSKSDFILGKVREIQYDSDPKQFEKKITYGFKLMSCRYADSVAKDDVDSLPANNDIIWNGSVFENEINSISNILLSDAGFKRFNLYHSSINECLGSTVALNYLTLCIKKWHDLQSPSTPGKKQREFILSSRILFDRFVYEYSTSQWKGSSDSRLNRNLTTNYDEVFKPIDEKAWSQLIEEAFELNTIGGQKISVTILKALTYYFTMLRNIKFELDPDDVLHIDHIIPGSKFTSQFDSHFKDSLYNYALLPPDLNQRKTDNTLDKLDPVDYKEVCSYESLDEKTAIDIKTPDDIDKLIVTRKFLVKEITSRRVEFINGTGDYWLLK